MITIESFNCLDIDLGMKELLSDCTTLEEKVYRAIDVAKSLPINGCITGSCWLPDFDPEAWDSTPDIDIFVYSEADLIRAIEIATGQLGMKPGKGTDRSEAQERWKINRLFEQGLNYRIGITTYTFYCEGIMFNFTLKMRKHKGKWIQLTSCPDVLMSFDMSIVMQGYDIKSHVFFDLRPDHVPTNVAIPNPLRKQDCAMWTVAKWVRQFDRVVKYYGRGIDTRPMAEFYLKMIDECIDAGCLFDSEESQEAFMNFSKEFLEKRAMIADWLEAHKED